MTQEDQEQGHEDKKLLSPTISIQQGLQGEEAAAFLAEISQAVDSTEPGTMERLQKVGAVVDKYIEEGSSTVTREGTVPTLTELQEQGSKSNSPTDWAEWIIQQLHAVVKDDLPEAYHGDVQSFLADLWIGDMPWIEPLATRVEQVIRAHPDFQSLRTKFQERFNADFWEPNWEAEWKEEEGRYIDL